MNKEQQELLDEAYRKYSKIANSVEEPDYEIHVDDPHQNCTRLMTTDEFINKCKTDSEFSQKWGLKIEERELSLEERYDLVETDKHIQFVKCQSLGTDRIKEVLDEKNIPTKLITITYSDKTIESYG